MTENTSGAAAGVDPVRRALNESKADRAALKGQLDPLFRTLYTDFLCQLGEIYKDNPQAFAEARHRVLNLGNRMQREAEQVLGCFAVRQMLVRKTVVHAVAGQGPWNLPPGVLHPNQRDRR